MSAVNEASACATARTTRPSGVLDDVVTNEESDMQKAIDVLEAQAKICTTNAVINRAEGSLDQADLEERNAESYRAAIDFLEAGM